MPATLHKLAQGEESRERLVAAAIALFGEGGYASTSVSAIAAHAGVVKSAIFWHFGTKHGLLLAALEAVAARWAAEVGGAAVACEDAPRLLARISALVRGIITERRAERRLIFGLLLERGAKDPEITARVCEVFADLRVAVTDGLARVTPVPRERLEPIADHVVSVCDGLFLRHLVDPDEARLEAALEELRRVVVLRLAQEIEQHQPPR